MTILIQYRHLVHLRFQVGFIITNFNLLSLISCSKGEF